MSAEEPTLKDVWQTQQQMQRSLQDLSQTQQQMQRSLQHLSQTQQQMQLSLLDMQQSHQELWRVVASLNRRMGERFDVVERQIVALDTRVSAIDATITTAEAKSIRAMGALKESIEARDFRLDDHGRRLTSLEGKLP